MIRFDVEETPEEEVEEQCVEVDAAKDRPCKLGELAPQLVAVGVPGENIKTNSTTNLGTQLMTILANSMKRTNVKATAGKINQTTNI